MFLLSFLKTLYQQCLKDDVLIRALKLYISLYTQLSLNVLITHKTFISLKKANMSGLNEILGLDGIPLCYIYDFQNFKLLIAD